MTLHFTFTENDALALTERYVRDSKSLQATRTRGRWIVPCLFTAMACFHTWKDGFLSVIPIVSVVFAIAWWFFYPRRFDSRVRAQVKKQMEESTHAKHYGSYELELLDEHLHSTSPLGSST